MKNQNELAIPMTAFENYMRVNTARLMDFARPYVGRLSPRDKARLLQDALTYAWQQREAHNPNRESILQYWDRCLRAAALERSSWAIYLFDGSTKLVPGHKLGKESV